MSHFFDRDGVRLRYLDTPRHTADTRRYIDEFLHERILTC